VSGVSFDEAALLAEARAAARLEDFGGDDFLPGLRALLRSYDAPAWSEKGRTRNRRRLVNLLATRLKIEAALAQHPEILARPVRRPVVLTGLPRSGTSALFSLLGADPAARPLRLWETQCPDPLPLPPGTPDPRRAAIEAYYAQGREKRPEFTKIHFTSADTPEECVLLHAYAMHGVQMGVEIFVEPYASWYQAETADLRALYAYQKRLMQLLDWQRPGERWLLKAPAHLWGLDALVATFPDVAIVWNHRDPVSCMASACSMTQALMATLSFEPKQLGPAVLEFYARSLDRGLAVREKLDPARLFDVPYAEFSRSPLACAERIYAHFDLPLPPASRDAIRAFAVENPEGKHGKHEYDLAQYGLDEEIVRARFAGYVARFGGLHE
jgi:hypothetical protein